MIDPQKTVGDKARPLQNIHEDIDIGAEHIVRNNKQCIYSYAGRNCLLDLIFINCNWVVTRWQWLFYMYTNMKKEVTRKFKSGGLHERHVVATWKLGNHLSIRL